ncbi:sensor histidine kinase [Streptomyces sp. SP17BM10]|nr:sensor histidine kinase [Streptomyces sp. SP17BM10]MEE1786746.1 sensor histidine kinase [Streptomyces sp. SP17BM10]
MHRLNAWLRRHPMVVDAAWAAIVLFLGLLPNDNFSGGWRFDAQIATAVALPALMVFRRRLPDLTVTAATAIALGQVCANVDPAASSIAYLVFAYTGAAFGRTWTSRLALAAGLLAGPLAYWRMNPAKTHFADDGVTAVRTPYSVGEALLIMLLMSTPFILCWAWGRLTRVRRAYLTELEDRAARLERERDAQSKVAVAAERARIARELHDVVAHNVSVMIVQADGAAYVLDNSPQQAKEALGTIASTGRQALVEMRRLLGVLRTADTADEYVPQPGVEELPELLEQVRTAGLRVDYATSGHPRELPRGVELTVYRIVQEALTNVRKHGGPDVHARVAVDFGERELAVLVEDDGRGTTDEQLASGGTDGLGHGLIGMRERVGMVSGSLDVGPRPGGGFRIRAVLPLKTAH